MLVNHKFQFFLDFPGSLFLWDNFLFLFLILGLSLLLFIVLFLIIRLFAGWRYAGRIFNAVSAREGDLRVPQPERPPSRSHPVGHGRSSALLCVLRC